MSSMFFFLILTLLLLLFTEYPTYERYPKIFGYHLPIGGDLTGDYLLSFLTLPTYLDGGRRMDVVGFGNISKMVVIIGLDITNLYHLSFFQSEDASGSMHNWLVEGNWLVMDAPRATSTSPPPRLISISDVIR